MNFIDYKIIDDEIFKKDKNSVTTSSNNANNNQILKIDKHNSENHINDKNLLSFFSKRKNIDKESDNTNNITNKKIVNKNIFEKNMIKISYNSNFKTHIQNEFDNLDKNDIYLNDEENEQEYHEIKEFKNLNEKMKTKNPGNSKSINMNKNENEKLKINKEPENIEYQCNNYSDSKNIKKDFQYYLNNLFLINKYKKNLGKLEFSETSYDKEKSELETLKVLFDYDNKEEIEKKFISTNSFCKKSEKFSYLKIKESEINKHSFFKSKIYQKYLDIIFDDFELELGYSTDYILIDDNLIFVSIYFNKKIQKILISFITFKRTLKNGDISMNKIKEENIFYEGLTRKNLIKFNVKIVPNTSLVLISFNEDNYLIFYDHLNISNKMKSHVNLRNNFFFDNELYDSDYNFFVIFYFNVKNYLNKVDFLINDNIIEIIIADFDFKLLHYKFYVNTNIIENLIKIYLFRDILNEDQIKDKNLLENYINGFDYMANMYKISIFSIKLISTFEKIFFSKITDIKFFNIYENKEKSNDSYYENKIKNISLKKKIILDENKTKIKGNKNTSNNKYKKNILENSIKDHNNENMNIINHNKINNQRNNIDKTNKKIKSIYFGACSRDGYFRIFSLSNCKKEIFNYKSSELWITSINFSIENKIFFLSVNTNEKIIGIKFFSDKEFLVKRIPMTENSISCRYSKDEDYLYFLNDNNNINFVKCSHFQNLFKNYKTRCRKNYTAEKVLDYTSKDLPKNQLGKNLQFKDENYINEGNNYDSGKDNFFRLNDEIVIFENEDKIFNFKILNSNNKNYNINETIPNKNSIKNAYIPCNEFLDRKRVFVIDRINIISIFYD